MTSFSLPKSFCDRIYALPPEQTMRLLKAFYNYMYSDGSDTAIDKINSPMAQPIIQDFKAFAARKFAARERARQRALSRPKSVRLSENTITYNGMTVKQMRDYIVAEFPDATNLCRVPPSKIPHLFNMLYCRFTPKGIRAPLLSEYVTINARAA